jgi:hypothetical protein
MFGAAFRSLVGGGRGRRTAADVVKSWIVRARLGAAPTGQLGKRRNRRWSWNDRLRACVGNKFFDVTAVNVSAGGAGLLVPHRLELGTVIAIQDGSDAPWIEARVSHVDGPDNRGLFVTGVQFAAAEPVGDGDEV